MLNCPIYHMRPNVIHLKPGPKDAWVVNRDKSYTNK